jgi:anti-sigma B factor antagonist
MGDLLAFAVESHDSDPRRPVVAVHGEVDLLTAPELAECVAAAIATGPLDVVLDLTDMTFVDCSGISVFVSAQKELSAERHVVLRHPRPFVRQTLGILEIGAICVISE